MRPQLWYAFGRQREAHRVRMTSVAGEQLAAGLEGVEQVEGADGTARSVRFAVFVRQHQGGPPVTLNHAGGGDADDAAMPAIAVDHYAMRVAQIRLLLEAAVDGLQDAALFFLAFGVELVQTRCNLSCACRIFDAE